MKDEQIDRLLDEGLKSYSRVEPPAEFTERVAESVRGARDRRASSSGRERTRRWLRRWWWVPLPELAAAAVLVLVVFARHPAPVTPPSTHNQPPSVETSNPTESANKSGIRPTPDAVTPQAGAQPRTLAAARKPHPEQQVELRQVIAPRRNYRKLTPEEMATTRFRPEMFPSVAAPDELVVPDLTVPEMKVPDVNVPRIEIQPIEPQRGPERGPERGLDSPE